MAAPQQCSPAVSGPAHAQAPSRSEWGVSSLPGQLAQQRIYPAAFGRILFLTSSDHPAPSNDSQSFRSAYLPIDSGYERIVPLVARGRRPA